jgi:hypothetical protein
MVEDEMTGDPRNWPVDFDFFDNANQNAWLTHVMGRP